MIFHSPKIVRSMNPAEARIRFMRCFFKKNMEITFPESMAFDIDLKKYFDFKCFRSLTMFIIVDLFSFSVRRLPFQFKDE